MPSFVPRQRKHKVLERLTLDEKQSRLGVPVKKTESVFASETVTEEKRKIVETGSCTPQPKASGKKKKRLDKYIVKFPFCGMSLIDHQVTNLPPRTPN